MKLVTCVLLLLSVGCATMPPAAGTALDAASTAGNLIFYPTPVGSYFGTGAWVLWELFNLNPQPAAPAKEK